jgi:hypothetical protein
MKQHFSIPTSIEKRLHLWSDRAGREPATDNTPKPCITISREYGCQAYRLADTIFQRLNEHAPEGEEWTMLDRLLLDKIAQEAGWSKSELNYTTHSNPAISSMLANLMGPNSTQPMKAFALTKEVIRYFARAGNTIIIGRGGVAVTQNFPNTIHVRLIAPMEFKVANLMKSIGLSESEATERITERQGERNKFIKHFTHLDLSDPGLYHLILSNDKSTIREMSDLVISRIQALMEKLASGNQELTKTLEV